jgi:DNA-binding IclR family transcriptional regulator
MDKSSGVGVLDKAAVVLGALEAGPSTLAQLVAATGLARPTAHRLAVALEHHRFVARDMQGRFILGPRLAELAQVLLAWEEPERLHRGLQGARFNAPALAAVRRRGWAQSVGEREPGVASVSAPVRGANGRVVAAVSVSGPVERLTRQPGRLHAAAVLAAAASLTEVVQRSQT